MRRLIAVAAILALAGCGTAAPPAAAPTTTRPTPKPIVQLTPGAGCARPGETPVRFARSDGARLGGLELSSTGTVGIVLAHEHNSTMCTWLPHGRRLAARGYRVFAFDFATYGSSRYLGPVNLVADVTAAAQYLIDRGAERIVLMGGSMGASAVVAAAPGIPKLAAVVSLSAPARFLGADAAAAAPRIRAPLLCVAADRDWVGDHLTPARRMCEAAGAAGPRELLATTGTEHGTQLVAVADWPAARAIDTLLGRYAKR